MGAVSLQLSAGRTGIMSTIQLLLRLRVWFGDGWLQQTGCEPTWAPWQTTKKLQTAG